ncbi:MAG: manganese efflux pump MntP family protein [Peptoniphilaceae bacterium]|nr:manganese efflux pump MntP family protein [Peptoniphilaceae bacterium]MDY6085469.1 manganese efflux pump MntP family protein [Peptoniphilaceae bacterium]
MSFPELLLLAFGVSMDAFSVAICKGLAVQDVKPRQATIVGAYFGGFQILMPLLGFFLGTFIAGFIQAIDHWVIFGILGYLGVEMIREALHPEACPTGDFDARTMLPLAIATSIDAFAVGIAFAMMQVHLAVALGMIGLCTFAFSFLGVYIGHFFGERWQKPAGIVGGAILIGIGVRVLVTHLMQNL